jgi:hypothetical protein
MRTKACRKRVRAVVGEGFEEERGVAVDLEDALAVVADGKEGAFVGGSLRDGHLGSFVASPAVVKSGEEKRGEPSAER